MRGHIVKPSPSRGNLWAVVVDLPRDPITGKRKQKWHSGFKTRKLAESALADILTRLDQGAYVQDTRKTLAEFLDEWLPSVRSTIRPSTYATYETVVNTHVKPKIGSLPLRAVTPMALKTLYSELLASGRKDGKRGLSPATVRYVHAVLRRALKDAVRSNLVTRNVAELVDPPRVHRKQITTWSAREVRAFLDHVKDDRLYAAYVLAATTGMRRGEVLGLRWQDVDLEAGRVSVSQTLVVVNGYEVQFSEPKTARGRRMVALDEQTLAALREQRERQMLERALWGDAYEDADLVFAREDGTPLHPDLFSDAFWRHVAQRSCHASGSTTCATRTRRSHSLPAFTRRSFQNVSGTRLLRSRSTPTRTRYLRCRRQQRSSSHHLCSTTEVSEAARRATRAD